MNEVFREFLLTWLVLWVVLVAACFIIYVTARAVVIRWRCSKEVQRRRQGDADRLNRDTAASVQRIGAAFVVAQQLIRDEAARNQGGRQ